MAAREIRRWRHQPTFTSRHLCARRHEGVHLVLEKQEADRDLRVQFAIIPKLGYSSCGQVLS
jgi:hypothetical protein